MALLLGLRLAAARVAVPSGELTFAEPESPVVGVPIDLDVDVSGDIKRVDYWIGSECVAIVREAPYTYAWTPDDTGAVVVSVYGRTTGGALVDQISYEVTVALGGAPPPEIVVNNPGTVYESVSGTFSAATTGETVTSVDFYWSDDDGETWHELGTDSSGTTSWSVAGTITASGSVTIRARAYAGAEVVATGTRVVTVGTTAQAFSAVDIGGAGAAIFLQDRDDYVTLAMRGYGTTPPTVTLTSGTTIARGLWLRCSTGGTLGTAEFEWSNDDGATYSAAIQPTADPIVVDGRTLTFGAGTYTTGHTYRAVLASCTDVANSYTLTYAATPTDRRPVYYTVAGDNGRPGPYFNGTSDAGYCTDSALLTAHTGSNQRAAITAVVKYQSADRTTATLNIAGLWAGETGLLTLRHARNAGGDLYYTSVANGSTTVGDMIDPCGVGTIHCQAETESGTIHIGRNGGHCDSAAMASYTWNPTYLSVGVSRNTSKVQWYKGFIQAVAVYVPTATPDRNAISSLLTDLGLSFYSEALDLANGVVIAGDMQDGDLEETESTCRNAGLLSSLAYVLEHATNGTLLGFGCTGDIIRGTEDDTGDAYDDRFDVLSNVCSPSAAGGLAPFFGVYGNHDVSEADRSVLWGKLTWQADAARSPTGKHYSSFALGGMRFIVVQDCLSEEWNATQREWFTTEVANATESAIFVLYHERALYTLDSYGSGGGYSPKITDYHKIVEEKCTASGQTGIFLCGHAHVHTRSLRVTNGAVDNTHGLVHWQNLPSAAVRNVCRREPAGAAYTLTGDTRTETGTGATIYGYGCNATFCGFTLIKKSGNELTLEAWDVNGRYKTTATARKVDTLTLTLAA